ncbi:YajQ family cyclic di-GMP-binding protein [Echinimonas agarilytica]|uniref:Nucleotide-binding protein NAF29_16165 n=1 Tax=Echinimonas agarilytica TaxID=1215918 RepID=A0AA41WB08_9GAMM|nr:YajQ family cyclic di-GMP-binding protein [Echinimonas agarilytica]MCM2681183.1 YajQ family cyclic di-GMP-binding protein [Echinimonas agarilytica]
MPSFDIVSEVDEVEVNNSVANASRELETRFDFRNVEASFNYKDLVVTMKTESDFQLRQMEDILRKNLAKRHVDPNAISLGSIDHTGKTYSQPVTFKQGLEQPYAKKLVKQIKESKFKVQASIQGDKLRVTGKKRDDLQQVIAFFRSEETEQPLQYENFRD